MADIPPFLEVPGVPGGRVAMDGLSPDAQQRYLAQYGGAPSFPATPGGLPPEPPLMNPEMTDQQKQSLHDTFRLMPERTLGDVLATDHAIGLAKGGGFDLAAQPPPAPSAAPTTPPTGTQSLPPTGQAGGPLGAATATLKGSFPGAGMSMPHAGGSGEREMRSAFEEKQKADVAAAEAGRSAAIQSAAAQDEYAKQVQAYNAQAAEREAQRQKYVDEQMKHVQDAQAELQKPGQPIDPDRYWKNKGTGQKVLAGIAVFLSGLGSGLQGRAGQNQAFDYIQSQVDKDIQLQKESAANDRERKRDALTGSNNLYRMYLDKGMDERQAESATRLTMAQGVDTKLRALEAKSKVETFTAGIQQLIAANDLNMQKAVEDLRNNSAQRFAQTASGTAALMNAQTNRFEAGVKAATGTKGPQLPAGEAAKVGELDAAIGMLKDVGSAHEKLGAGSSFAQWIGGTKSAQYRDKIKVATQVIGNILEGGKLTDKDYDRYLGMMPAAGDFSATALNKIQSIADLLQKKRDGNVGAWGSAGYDTSRFPQSSAQKRDKYGAVEH
jgi:hypothetical protein